MSKSLEIDVSEVFLCPKCSGTSLEEVVVNCVVTSEVSMITGYNPYDEDFEVDYSAHDITYGDVISYQCGACGFIIPGVKDAAGLFKYFKGIIDERC